MGIYNFIVKDTILPLTDIATGTNIKKYYLFLKKSQFWPIAKHKEYQNRKLRELIKYAYNNVPYYHKRWHDLKIDIEKIKTVKDLKKIPVTTKEDIRNNFERLKSKDFQNKKCKLNQTGGSTGEPLKYWLDWDTYSLNWASTIRGWSWADYQFGDKLVVVGGSSLSPDDKEGLKNKIKNKIIFRKVGLSAFDMGPKDIKKYFEIIDNYKPKYIRGYPSALAILAKEIPERFKGFSNLKGAFTTAEVLYDSDRKIIEEAFDVKVFDGYGARDGNINAMECEEHNGLHLTMETSIGEFIKDKEDVSNGEVGNIIVTCLTNYSFPFIRYEIGDLGIPSDEICECSRNLPLIKEIQGRTTEIIQFPDGTKWAGPVLTLVFARFDVIEYQVIQEDMNLIKIKIIKGDKFTNEDEKNLLHIFNSHKGKDGIVKIEYTEKIEKVRSGKRRFIISNINK